MIEMLIIFVMKMGMMVISQLLSVDGTPCAVKVARTVWSRGKSGDYFKGLPIAIVNIADFTATT